MSADRELDGLVRSWIKQGGSSLSDRVVAAVMADLPTTAQRRVLRPGPRWRALPVSARYAIVSGAAVVMIVVAGLGLLLGRPGPSTGPLVPTAPTFVRPTPTPASRPSPSPGSTPSPGTSAAVTRRTVIGSLDGLRISFDLPFGWDLPIHGAGPGSGGSYPSATVDFLVDISDVRLNPCRRTEPGSGLGPTSGDLARVLRAARSYAPTEPVDIRLGGYLGQHMTLQMPTAFDACRPYEVRRLWKASPYDGAAIAGTQHELWILDVADIRLLIDAQSMPGTPAEILAAQQLLVDSILIERIGTDAHPIPSARPVVTVDAVAGLRITYELPRDWSHGSALASSIWADPGAPTVTFGTIDRVPRYPCTMPTFGIGPGPDTSVDQLLLAFDRVTEYDRTEPVNVSLSGFAGKRIDLIMPPETAEPACVHSTLDIWSSGDAVTHGRPGERHVLRILDVDGIRLVIDATSFAGTPATDLVAQQELIDSIRIERTAP